MTEVPQQQTLLEHVIESPAELDTWVVFVMYMIGALLRVLWLWADWRSETGNPWLSYWSDKLDECVKSLIAAVVLAFIWTQGLLFILVDRIGIDVPQFGKTHLSSIAVGFSLEWLVGNWIHNRTILGGKPKKEISGG